MSVNSSFDVSISSRDFYNNDITIGYGDDTFHAWVYQTMGTNKPATVRDNGDGSYVVHAQTDSTTGTVFLFVQRDGLNVPGSPFEVRLPAVVGACGLLQAALRLPRMTKDSTSHKFIVAHRDSE